jgi:type I restriction enzyme R subunit
MTKITESQIEKYGIELLETQGYHYLYGPNIAPDSSTPARASFDDVLLLDHLRKAVNRINPAIPADAREEAIKQLQRIHSRQLIANNETFHRMLTEGINITYQKGGYRRGDLVWLVDFEHPENNDFLVVNQFTVTSTGSVTGTAGSVTGSRGAGTGIMSSVVGTVNKRPDIVLFVNGLPLVVIELKNPADENATVYTAFKQMQTYLQAIPALFICNGCLVISDGLEAKTGSLSAEYSRFMAWKSADGKVEASPLIGQLETLIKGMLNPATLLDLIRHFIVFEKGRKEDKTTGIITIETIKKMAGYHQYYAVNRAVESTFRAASTKLSNHASTLLSDRASTKFSDGALTPLNRQKMGALLIKYG